MWQLSAQRLPGRLKSAAVGGFPRSRATSLRHRYLRQGSPTVHIHEMVRYLRYGSLNKVNDLRSCACLDQECHPKTRKP